MGFAAAYAVVQWYYAPYVNGRKSGVPCCAICRGYLVGLVFHLGSLTFGAILVAVVGFIRAVIAAFVDASKDTGNGICACCGKICLCCVDCFKRCLEFINKTAYMD